MTQLRIPTATYRLQFNHLFTFKEALSFIDYFHELGISDLYASPITKASKGSLHGYDVIDCNQLNPEIGSEEEFEQMIQILQSHGMGFIADIVPNHMCIANSSNKWWIDVLENGPNSLYSNHFNVIWNPPTPELKNKVLLAVLEQPYGKVIENQEFKLIYESGAFLIEYKNKEHRFPVNPLTWPFILAPVVKQLLSQIGETNADVAELQSILTALEHLPGMEETDLEKCKERNREKEIIKKRLSTLFSQNSVIAQAIQNSMANLNGIKGDPRSFDRLEELLKAQAYRLSFWRVMNDEINYRRFFDVSDLASMRVENECVFHDMHELILHYVHKGWVTGLRIDHIDGLFDPQEYLNRLQKACNQKKDTSYTEMTKDFFIIVEKILGGKEDLRQQWPIFGTTGYEYLNVSNGVFVLEENREKIFHIYENFIQRREDMAYLFYKCKKIILMIAMSSELQILARHLKEISEQHRWSCDYTTNSLRFALQEVIASFPVYRSYIRLEDSVVQEEDRVYVTIAVQQAKRRCPSVDPSIFDFIASVLLLLDPAGLTENEIMHRRQFVMRLQQLTGPVTAKGVEDTALYQFYPLASINEVGMDVECFGISIQTFHQKNQERNQKWPHTFLATSTHDTKRSEDVRARLNVLSEIPDVWGEAVNYWKECNQVHKITLTDYPIVPDANEEFLIYQTLVGSWPLYSLEPAAHLQYVDRIQKYIIKALKEAKIHTNWTNPDEIYENTVKEFIKRILTIESTDFLKHFEQFCRPVIKMGLYNSLSQLLLKMTVPGIPDFYQGNELWEFTLVDPDNRRPVDYSYRKYTLDTIQQKKQSQLEEFLGHLITHIEDGQIKLFVTMQVLRLRREHPLLFQQGGYIPLEIEGPKAFHLIGFGRIKDAEKIIVLTSRVYSSLLDSPQTTIPVGKIWQDTHLVLPDYLQGEYQDVFSGSTIQTGEKVAVETLFNWAPFTLLVCKG
jgi:(1->4)-alpha-D-glucan 1-alpha-D-glucosylmutase